MKRLITAALAARYLGGYECHLRGHLMIRTIALTLAMLVSPPAARAATLEEAAKALSNAVSSGAPMEDVARLANLSLALACKQLTEEDRLSALKNPKDCDGKVDTFADLIPIKPPKASIEETPVNSWKDGPLGYVVVAGVITAIIAAIGLAVAVIVAFAGLLFRLFRRTAGL